MEPIAMLYVTCPNAELARRIAKTLLERRLVACANLLPGQSLYRWEGRLHEENETVLVMKTRAELVPPATDATRALHTDATPCIVAYEALAADAAYAAWIASETTANP